MHIILKLKADRNERVHFTDNNTAYYAVSNIFWETCQAAGNDLIIESQIQSHYDEEVVNYPASRIFLKDHEGRHLVGLKPR